MRTELKVFSRLFGKHYATDLSAADDIGTAANDVKEYSLNEFVQRVETLQNSFLDQYESLKGKAEEFIAAFDELEDQYQTYSDLQDKLEGALSSFEGMAEDLGIDAEASEAYRNGQEAFEQSESDSTSVVQFQNQAFDTYDKANNLFR